MTNKASFIIRDAWPRLDAAAVERFRGIPTALIADAMGHGFGVIDHRIRPVWPGPDFVGSALPVETAPHDILAVHAAVKFSMPGDVIVIATGRSMKAAVLGEMTVKLLGNGGIVAAVTDGVVRDLQALEAAGLPVYASGVSPGIPFKNGPGRIGLPVSVGGIAVGPGDIVVGDRDGIVVIPMCHANHVFNSINIARQIDDQLGDMIAPGVKVPPYVERALKDEKIQYVND